MESERSRAHSTLNQKAPTKHHIALGSEVRCENNSKSVPVGGAGTKTSSRQIGRMMAGKWCAQCAYPAARACRWCSPRPPNLDAAHAAPSSTRPHPMSFAPRWSASSAGWTCLPQVVSLLPSSRIYVYIYACIYIYRASSPLRVYIYIYKLFTD